MTRTLVTVVLVLAGALGGYLAGSRGRAATTAPSPATVDATAVYRAARPAIATVTTDLARLDSLEARGVGTAFHIGDGYYVTSAHVIEGATTITLNAGDDGAESRELKAAVVAADRPSDLAVLRAEPVTAALEWAEATPPIGAWVAAIGNPFGQAPGSLSTGVLSGTNRLVLGPTGTLVGLVQSDAALNPGNSGGPLLDASGRVIGVNAAILTTTGAWVGIGYSVPAANARRIVDTLRAGGKVEHPSLGVTGDPDGPAVIARVLPGGAAARAGLKPGDTVTRAAGYTVDTFEELGAVIAAQAPGATVKLRVKRGRESVDVTVTLD